MITIAVDAHGGDYAPGEVIKGAIDVVEECGDIEILLVGIENIVRATFNEVSQKYYKQIKIVNAEEIIEMNDLPATAVRRKKRSSIHIGLRLVADKKASAFYSAGNTGAVMAASKLILGTLKGVERPAIAVVLPNIKGHTIMLDVGANINCKPAHFLQFAVMGSVYSKVILNIDNPRIGLLSIGEEEVKGNDLLKTVYNMLKEVKMLNFIGNVEGKQLYKGVADVVLTDGFTGNIALKTSESVGWYISTLLKEELSRNFLSRIGGLLIFPALSRVKKRADYSEYGGALLIGVGGISIIGHGSSDAKAIKNGIKVARSLSEKCINEKIEDNINDFLGKQENFWQNMRDRLKDFAKEESMEL